MVAAREAKLTAMVLCALGQSAAQDVRDSSTCTAPATGVLGEGGLFLAPGALWEAWTGMGSSNSLSVLTGHARYPDQPDRAYIANEYFETERNWLEEYGARISGWFQAPQDGAYVFFISGDDQHMLSLDGTTIIAAAGHRPFRSFGGSSSAQQLVAGELYFLEALVKEGRGGDHLSVGVRLPDFTELKPIPVPGYIYYAHPLLDQDDTTIFPSGALARPVLPRCSCTLSRVCTTQTQPFL
jgi:hypothetical protein